MAPFGQRTTFELNTDGYLSKITNPAGEANQFGYTSDGLLTSLTDPRGNGYSYSYDTMGRLIRDENPAGGFTALGRTETEGSNLGSPIEVFVSGKQGVRP